MFGGGGKKIKKTLPSNSDECTDLSGTLTLAPVRETRLVGGLKSSAANANDLARRSVTR